MKRELKFRAWGEPNEYHGYPEGCMTYNAQPDCDADAIMQFTGLHDKNGREVYEGDIIRVEIEEPFQRVHGEFATKEVVYRNGVWVASYLSSKANLPKGYTAGELTLYREYEGKEAFFANNKAFQKLVCEVIGNIYENPELLEEAP